jgi:hypothetical protein
MPSEKIVDGQTYRLGRLNAKQQFHVARRLAPVVAAFTGGAEGIPLALAEAVSKLPDDACDYVMRTTMSVVHRRVGDQWAAVWNQAADQPQFADISAPVLIDLVIAVVQENLGDFTSGLVDAGTAPSSTAPSARLN